MSEGLHTIKCILICSISQNSGFVSDKILQKRGNGMQYLGWGRGDEGSNISSCFKNKEVHTLSSLHNLTSSLFLNFDSQGCSYPNAWEKNI